MLIGAGGFLNIGPGENDARRGTPMRMGLPEIENNKSVTDLVVYVLLMGHWAMS